MARHKEFDKAEVLQKAILLFWRQGYDATSVRDLIQAMGISSSSLYETFGDKRAIYIAALTAYCQQEREAFQLLLSSSPNPKDALSLSFDNAKSQVGGQSQGLFSINSIVEFGTRDAEITAILWQHYQSVWEILSDTLKQAQANKSISSTAEMTAVAHSILTALYGYASILRVKPDFTGGDSILHTLQSLLD